MIEGPSTAPITPLAGIEPIDKTLRRHDAMPKGFFIVNI